MITFPPFSLDTVNQCLWRIGDYGADERILLPPKAFGVQQVAWLARDGRSSRYSWSIPHSGLGARGQLVQDEGVV